MVNVIETTEMEKQKLDNNNNNNNKPGKQSTKLRVTQDQLSEIIKVNHKLKKTV